MSDVHNLRVAVMGAAVKARRDLAAGRITWAELVAGIAARFAGRGVSEATIIDWVREAVPEPKPTRTRIPAPQSGGAEVVPVGATCVPVATVDGQRVVTLAMVDEVHQRPAGTAGRNFRQNEARLIEGVDYFRICADEIRRRKILDLSPRARGDIVLLTETGYLMLVKSFQDDLAWQVQRRMVTAYFKAGAARAGGSAALGDDPARTIGGIVKGVVGRLIAEAIETLCGVIHARFDALERSLAGSGAADAAANPGEPGGGGFVSALAVVVAAGGGAGHRRSLSALVSARLRRFSEAAGFEVRRAAEDGRCLFDPEAVRVWLGAEGRDLIRTRAAAGRVAARGGPVQEAAVATV